MNERIRELKYQAEALAYEEHKANCIKNGLDPSMPHANALNMTFEKFARLIVLECEKVAKDPKWYGESPSNGWRNPIRHVCTVMKEHFGVEE